MTSDHNETMKVATDAGLALAKAVKRNAELEAEIARLKADLDEASFNAAAIKGLWETQRKTIATLTADNERLSARIERLEAALKPFARDSELYEPDEGDSEFFAWDSQIKIGDLRTARRELEEGK